MAARSDEAVVIRLSDYSETSQIATLFTRGDGLVRVIAKGMKRSTKSRVSVGLDLLEYGQAEFQPARADAGLGALHGWTQRDSFTGIREDMLCLYGGLYAAELVHSLTQEHDPHGDLFDSLLLLLRRLSGETVDGQNLAPPRAIVRFQADLLLSIGYAPSLRACASCSAARIAGQPAYFSSTAGGLLCGECAPRQREKHAIPMVLVDGPRGSTTPAQWFALLDYHLCCIAGRAFETAIAIHRLLADASDDTLPAQKGAPG